MMDAFDLASRLFGNSRAESRGDVSNSLDILTATSAGDSSDGAATVYLDADVTPADDYDGDDYAIGIPTSPNVIDGDGVLVGLTGSGPLKTPVVISNPGSGDRMAVSVSNAETLAEQAEAVATATGQHFWTDNDGIHVTEVTQDEWSDSTSPNYHSGANVLLNALGQLFRDGLNNILAIVSGTDPGVAIYDGEGNSSDNILALLTKSLIRLGGRFAASGRSTAKVQFFEDDSALTDLTATHYIDTTTEPQVSHDLALSSTITDDELPNGTSRTVTGNVEVWEQIYNDGTDYSDEVTVSLNGMATNRTNTVSMGIRAIQGSSGSWQRTAFAVADTLRLTHGTGEQASTSDIAMEQAIVALQQPYAMFTGSSGTATSTANGWHITWFNTVYSHSPNWSDYFSFSNGVITAKRNIKLEISGCMNWTDSVAGIRGFGVFVNSSTAGSGIEHSEFQMFPNTVNSRKSVYMAGLVLSLDANVHCAVGRFEQTNAVYVNGANFSRILLKVLGTF